MCHGDECIIWNSLLLPEVESTHSKQRQEGSFVFRLLSELLGPLHVELESGPEGVFLLAESFGSLTGTQVTEHLRVCGL